MTKPVDSSLRPVSFLEPVQDPIRNKSLDNRKLTLPETLQFKDSRTQYGENPHDPEFQVEVLEATDYPTPQKATESQIWTACNSLCGGIC